ncbi:RNA polymerase sigma factor [Enterococcus saccharolyticus]|uniref:RNA polymerase sigma factor n=1 Tax=Enterococcus TaxID=1350 RepID=UPI001E5ADAF4|nr:RNA polymerase sigma factor [Enterococcus saccharolyticus]MCD5002919.1 RNA polymerase sigma factor [Enterococcus saccharolyticus]
MDIQVERLLIQTANDLIAHLTKMGASLQDSQDIAQETLLKLFEVETEVPLNQMRPWMYRVGINQYYNLYNQTKRRTQILQQYFHYIPEEWNEYNDSLFNALNQLEVKTAHLLVLKYSEELTLKEIAFLLNRPEESLKTELYRARKKLRKKLEESEHGR